MLEKYLKYCLIKPCLLTKYNWRGKLDKSYTNIIFTHFCFHFD